MLPSDDRPRPTPEEVERGIRNVIDPFVLAPNDAHTWRLVTESISAYLRGLWSQGAFFGATAREAFRVECGLGSTMTERDLREGYLVVQVTLQMTRPAELIELTLRQKMEVG